MNAALSVELRPEGGGSYLVLLRAGLVAIELRRFSSASMKPTRADTAAASRAARAYRDGVAEGLYRAGAIMQAAAENARISTIVN